MPQGGSFPNIPDTPIGGDILVKLNGKTSAEGGVSDWSCSKMIATADTAAFGYIYSGGTAGDDRVDTFGPVPNGTVLDMVIDPKRVTSSVGLYFLCNRCDCDDAMTGTTTLSDTSYGYILTGSTTSASINPDTAFAPTIIGGGGLNN